MRPINSFRASIGPRLVRATGSDQAEFFRGFDERIQAEYDALKEDTKIKSLRQALFSMDEVTPSIRKAALAGNPEELARIKYIIDHASIPIIGETGKHYHGRTRAHFIIDKDHPRQEQLVSLLLTLDSDVMFLREIYNGLPPQGSFSVTCLLDNIRFKLLIIVEDFLASSPIIRDRPQDKNLLIRALDKAVNIYYAYILKDYLQPMVRSAIMELLDDVQKLCNLYLTRTLGRQDLRREVPNTGIRAKDELNDIELRWFKEAEHSLDTLMFISKLMKQIDDQQLRIDVIIGIRFGGIELPLLVRQQFVKGNVRPPEIRFYKGHSYHEEKPIDVQIRQTSDARLCKDVLGKNVLILDDNTTSGRGLERVLQTITPVAANVYFGCIAYSSYATRDDHFERDGQGMISREVLEAAVVLTQTNYATTYSRKRFTNRNNVFDFYKTRVKKQNEATSGIFGTDQVLLQANSVMYVCHKADLARPRVTKTIEQIRSHALHTGTEIVDDWFTDRVRVEGNTYTYLDPKGHDFLREAATNIRRAEMIYFIVDKESVYIRCLYLMARYFGRRIKVIGSDLGRLRRHFPSNGGNDVVSFTAWNSGQMKHG